MNHIKEGAKLVEGRMNFIQSFLQKKHGVEILFFTIIILGFITAVWFYNIGEENGKEDAKDTISSLRFSIKNDSIHIQTLDRRILYFTKRLDSCNNSSMSSNLEDLVTKRLEEAERIKRVLERKIANDKDDVNEIKKMIKN